MQTKFTFLDGNARTRSASAGSAYAPGGPAKTTQKLAVRATDELNHSMSDHHTSTAAGGKSKTTVCDQARTARQRFLAAHGPEAELPGRQVVAKEVRRAIVAAEMALWECF